MITVHRLNGTELVINVELIETVEATPDTTVTFTNGKKIMISESVDELLQKSLEYKKKIHLFSKSIDK